jgi:hypothetical protein
MPKREKCRTFSFFSKMLLLNFQISHACSSRFELWALAIPFYSSPSSEIASPEFTEGVCPELIDGSNGCGLSTPFLPFKRISTFFSASSSFWLQNRDSRMPSSKSLKDSSKGISPPSSFETIFSSLLSASSNLSFGIAIPFLDCLMPF